MLTIYISPYRSVAKDAGGVWLAVFPAFIIRGGRARLLEASKIITRIDGVRLLRPIRAKRGHRWRRVSLPKNVEQAIVYFLNNFHTVRDTAYSCRSFAKCVNGFPLFKRCKWQLKRLRGMMPKVGQTVALMDGNWFSHAAVYLGHHRFISVYGTGGGLQFSRLRDMRQDFKAKECYVATPQT